MDVLALLSGAGCGPSTPKVIRGSHPRERPEHFQAKCPRFGAGNAFETKAGLVSPAHGEADPKQNRQASGREAIPRQ
jgi:hypothetical protein